MWALWYMIWKSEQSEIITSQWEARADYFTSEDGYLFLFFQAIKNISSL